MGERAYRVATGRPYPLGATLLPGGVHFGLVSRHATRVWIQIYDRAQDPRPNLEIELNAAEHRTGDVWHADIHGLAAGAIYMFRVDGPFEPHNGLRFAPACPLLDPYARALTGGFEWHLEDARAYPDTDDTDVDLRRRGPAGAARLPKCIVVDPDFDWQGDRPLNYPLSETVIYETHVKGFTAHPSSGVQFPGTYRGLIEKIPYLQELGITSVELLPVHDFDGSDRRTDPRTGKPPANYWGYNSLAFFAPKADYAVDGTSGGQVHEFKTMVRALHAAGIEVILDVVFNHSGEGNHLGPTIGFRGIDNPTYYLLEDDRRYYRNFSGTGNTMNCNNPVMRTLITECLHYWVVDMHVDGFRFDLGSILSRDERGNLLEDAPILKRIAEDPILRDTKIIAEAWDAGGAYQVGGFRGRWAEWNDRFRDDVRRFWRGETGMVASLATRFAGSADLYHADGRKPFHSINFVTSHDGFTLRDLVSYNQKHNEANAEHNADGNDTNYSYNHGVEGDSDDPSVERLRLQQMKNFSATLLLSLGTPMMLGGDEFGRTQRGNNNAYCQDNEISWHDYRLRRRYAELFRFFCGLIALRKAHPVFRRPDFYTGRDNSMSTRPDIDWFDTDGKRFDWTETRSLLGIYIDGTEIVAHAEREDDDFYLMINATGEACDCVVPAAPRDQRWRKLVETAAAAPRDLFDETRGPNLGAAPTVPVAARSLVLLRSCRSH